MKVPYASTATVITSFKRMLHYMLPETRSRHTKESLQNLALTIPIHLHLMHTYCTIIAGWSVLKFRTSTHPRCHWNPQCNTKWELTKETVVSETEAAAIYCRHKAMVADTQSYLSGTSGVVSQSVSQSVIQSSKQRGNLRVVLEVDKVWPNFVICTLPIISLCTYCPKLQGLVSCSPRWTHKQLHKLRDVVCHDWY